MPAASPTAAAAQAVASGGMLVPGGSIAWSQARDDFRDIWTMNSDGTGPARLTADNSRNRWPAWSPDGRSIAFTSNRDGNNEIYVMRADGSNVTRLTNNPANDYAPAWSPDGRQMAFVSNRAGQDDIYVMRADGSNQTRLTDSLAFDSQPAWSPDGRLMAFTSNRDRDLNIYVMPAAGGQATRLTTDQGDDRDPAWSPDGSRLAFASSRTGLLQIYTMTPDGGDQRKITNFTRGAEHPSWGPASATGDAATIAFAAYTGSATAGAAAEIYEIRADGSEQRRLTDNAVEDSDPAWLVPAGAVALAPTPSRTPLPAATAAAPTAGATPSLTPQATAVASNEFFVDDLSPQFTRGGTAKYWKEAPIGYADHMYFTYSSARLDNWGRWTPKLPQAGTYEIFVYIPAQNATTQKASYTIMHAGKRDGQVINQMLYENTWLSLGTYTFNAKGGEYVQLGDQTGEATSTKRIGFDAVKWVYKAP